MIWINISIIDNFNVLDLTHHFIFDPHVDILVHNASNMYNTTCLKTTLDSQQSVLLGQNASFADGRFEIDETAITECAIAAQNGGLVEEGIPYVAGNTLWAVYQVIFETLNSDS